MALAAVEGFGCHRDEGADSGFPSVVQPLQLEGGRHEHGDELGISGCACSTAVNVGGDVVDFLAVFLDNDGATCGPGVGSQHYSSIILDTYDSGSCFLMLDLFGGVLLHEEFVSE